ncbi:MAG: YidC/Oxa1 family membrane protein insertase [Acetatifactor sp.]|nr:YidC/Oxa1 family membrane protein insertase [Acetatifactor sp.]
MTFLSILETLLIGPLKLVFEIIFESAYRIVGHPGLAIIFLSLTMNILVLPLYRRADAMQEEARDREAKLHDGVAHIKSVFSGDERMMILRTYYRQNDYKHTDTLNGSVSLLLEIPFFFAAYQFLSKLEIMQGVSLGPITDLGAPDGLLVIGGVTLNLLPILMTLINVVSSTLYLKGFPLKTKVQLYGIALFFLVFLYTSPACLVFYWTLNNVFSLGKNIFYKIKEPAKVLRILSAVVGLPILIYGAAFYNGAFYKRKAMVVVVGLLLLLPLFYGIMKKAVPFSKKKSDIHPDGRSFLLGTIFLTVLIGLLIPSVFIADSPQEYVDITYFHNPLWYIVSSFCMASGTFLIWMRVFYWLTGPRGKVVFERLVWVLCGVAIVDYMFFGTDLGVISPSLQYENDISFSRWQQFTNLLILAAVAAILYFCACRWKRAVTDLLLISIVAIGVMSAWNLITIKTSVDKISVEQLAEDEIPHFQISKTGRNVVVIMLDRAMGEYIPYLFQEKPELKEQFAGFTYYGNTISFGGHTNFAAPALFGGYEYTPVEINKRTSKSMVSEHNEALKVMPVLFSENDYLVTVCDPVYANYELIPDLSIYDDYPGVTAYITERQFGDVEWKAEVIEQNHKNFFCFGVMKSMPLFFQPAIYNRGRYIQVTSPEEEVYFVQTRDGLSLSTGIGNYFLAPYYVLMNLPNMTMMTEDEKNTFLLMTNNTTHEPMLLQEPDYIPANNVDNTVYDAENADRFVIDGRELKVEDDQQMIHYHANMAAMLQLGNWFDYLRKNNAYDNTRIILVSDHGGDLAHLEEFILDDGSGNLEDMEWYYPLLMVKDFNSEEFVTSDTFMTNADVPTLAMAGIISDPINPFTGNSINSDEKTAHDQFVILSREYDIDANNGHTFLPSKWVSIKDNIWDPNNWSFYNDMTVLNEHAAP